LALDELSNQLDRLSVLDADQRQAALAELAPSQEVRDALHDAKLSGRIVQDEDGTRLILKLDWERPGAPAPLELVHWLDTMPREPERSEDTGAAALRQPDGLGART
jgi:hypothetical protein